LVNGLALWVSFKDSVSEGRFKRWVENGNIKSSSMGVGGMGLKAHVVRVRPSEYLFLWEHFFILDLAWFLRVSFWFVTRKVRRGISVRSVKKLDVVELVMSRGLLK
jgi:hypothetical protein